jgi:hypothetical protein
MTLNTLGGHLIGPCYNSGKPTDFNWAALAIAILADKSVDRALRCVGIQGAGDKGGNKK